jgi:hypothetical protein
VNGSDAVVGSTWVGFLDAGEVESQGIVLPAPQVVVEASGGFAGTVPSPGNGMLLGGQNWAHGVNASYFVVSLPSSPSGACVGCGDAGYVTVEVTDMVHQCVSVGFPCTQGQGTINLAPAAGGNCNFPLGEAVTGQTPLLLEMSGGHCTVFPKLSAVAVDGTFVAP